MIDRDVLARIIHEARIRECWGREAIGVRDPWEKSNPASPNQPWHDIAIAQANAVIRALKVKP